MEIGERVELVDGGTSLLDFIPQRENVSKLIIVDAVKLGGKPGKTYKIYVDDSLLKAERGMTSLHNG